MKKIHKKLSWKAAQLKVYWTDQKQQKFWKLKAKLVFVKQIKNIGL